MGRIYKDPSLKKRKKTPNPREKVIEGKVCDHAKQLGCLVYKFTSPSRRSVPDRLFVMPNEKGTFFIEFKRRGEKPTDAQAVEIAKIRGQGTRVFIIDDIAEGKACVADMVHGVACGAHVFGYKGCDALEPGKCSFCGSKEIDGICQNYGCDDNARRSRQRKPITMADPFFN